MLKKFKDLSEKEILAIAIAAEEEDGRIYGEFADALRDEYPSTADMFEEMRQEEVGHRDRLFAMFRQRFGDHIPLIRRENVKGFLIDGAGGEPLLRAGGKQDHGRFDAGIIEQARG
jgi:rubrerythrin